MPSNTITEISTSNIDVPWDDLQQYNYDEILEILQDMEKQDLSQSKEFRRLSIIARDLAAGKFTLRLPDSDICKQYLLHEAINWDNLESEAKYKVNALKKLIGEVEPNSECYCKISALTD